MYNCHRELKSLGELGLNISVHKKEFLHEDKKLLEPGEDGFITKLFKNMPTDFIITTEARRSDNLVLATVVGGTRNIQSLKDHTPDDSSATYVKKVAAERISSGFTTKPSRNNFRIFSTHKNKFRMWEVAIVTRILGRDSLYFLTIQKIYEADMYNDDGNIWMPPEQYPGYEKWESLQNLLVRMVELDSLLDQSEYKPSKNKKDKDSVNPDRGRMLFFNLSGSYGLAEVNIEDFDTAIVYWSQINTNDRFTHLEEGQMVSFGYYNIKENHTIELFRVTPVA